MSVPWDPRLTTGVRANLSLAALGPGGDFLVTAEDRAIRTFALAGRFGAFGP